jgi:hypothetical protein
MWRGSVVEVLEFTIHGNRAGYVKWSLCFTLDKLGLEFVLNCWGSSDVLTPLIYTCSSLPT